MCKEIIEKWRVLVPVSAGMVLFSFFCCLESYLLQNQIDASGIPCSSARE